MTLNEHSVKDRNIDNNIRLKQNFIICTVGLAFLVNSMTLGLSAPLLPLLFDDPQMDISEEEGSWIASIVPGGAILGSLASSYLLDLLGRKNLLLISMISYIWSWAQIALTYNTRVIITARFLAGFCVGLISSSGVVYLAETVQENFRSLQAVLLGIFGTFGGFFMALLVNFVNWRGLVWAGVIVCLPPTISLFFLPETPLYLYRSSSEKSLRALKWLLEDESKISKKFKEMEEHLNDNLSTSLNLKSYTLFDKYNRFPVTVLMLLHIFQQLTGINALIFYSTDIFEDILEIEYPEYYTMLLSLLNIIYNLISSILQSFLKRRTLLKISTVISVPCLLLTSFSLITKDYFIIDSHSFAHKIPVIAIYLFVFAFAVGWGPVPFLFMGEGLPSSIRGNATGKAVALNWAFAFLVTKYFKYITALLGYGWVFFVFAFCTLMAGIIIDIYMPETFGKSLEEMESFYNKERRGNDKEGKKKE